MNTANQRRMRTLMLTLLLAVTGIERPRSFRDIVSHRADAEGLYLSQCAGCHGRDGKGKGPDVWRLPVSIHSFRDCDWMLLMSDATLFLIIKEGSSSAGFPAGMPAGDGKLSYDQIAQLVHYVRTFCLAK
jgi:mono/diheme cytochrome c family protein